MCVCVCAFVCTHSWYNGYCHRKWTWHLKFKPG